MPLETKAKFDQLLADKHAGKRLPPPDNYLTPNYVKEHLDEFQTGSVYKIINGPLDPTKLAKKGEHIFVFPKSEVDNAIAKSGGDPRKLEEILGMDPGYLGNNPHLVEFKNPASVEMPSGNEKNAWDGLWKPGGYTKGDSAKGIAPVKEAVIPGGINPKDVSSTPIRKGGRP